MRFQSLGVAFIFNIPHSYCLVVCHADDVFAAGVKQQASDPVVMTDLGSRRNNIHPCTLESRCFYSPLTFNLHNQAQPVNLFSTHSSFYSGTTIQHFNTAAASFPSRIIYRNEEEIQQDTALPEWHCDQHPFKNFASIVAVHGH